MQNRVPACRARSVSVGWGISLTRMERITLQLFQLQLDDCLRCPVKCGEVVREDGVSQINGKIALEFYVRGEYLLLDCLDDCRA